MEDLTLRDRAIAVLEKSGAPMTYRDLTTAIWDTYPDYRDHSFTRHATEAQARREVRVRLGGLVRNQPDLFTVTKSDGIVLVGLAASPLDVAEDEQDDEGGASPSIYWYSFPAYARTDGAFPIKVGRGGNPTERIARQVTSMPEHPVVLGTFEHPQAHVLERALHAVLTLRGKQIDAPGREWFSSTPSEISGLIKLLLEQTVP